jgi:hypothetical protein
VTLILLGLSQSHHSEVNVGNDARFEAAQLAVKEFLAARTVYRHFSQPIGGVEIDESQSYSIRGYFIPGQGNGYQFITYNPVKQFYRVTGVSTLMAICVKINTNLIFIAVTHSRRRRTANFT